MNNLPNHAYAINTFRKTNNVVYITWENKDNLKLFVHMKKTVIELVQQDVYTFISFIKVHLLENGFIIVGWDLKDFFTVIRKKSNNNIEAECNIFDIHVIQGFFGLERSKPSDWQEAVAFLSKINKEDNFANFVKLNKQIYNPLITKVLPNIESFGVINQEKIIYPHYNIEGQSFGRLSCDKIYGYNPHSTIEEERVLIKPKIIDGEFLYLDYKNMEVYVLQWLSGDERLKKALSLGVDFYKLLFKIINNKECATNDERESIKNIFIPIIYGLSLNSLIKQYNYTEDQAKKLVNRLENYFPTAFAYLKSKSTEVCQDYYGRKRSFEAYKGRNFSISGPANMICLNKLIQLNNLIIDARITATVHDGYLLTLPSKRIVEAREAAKQVLEAECDFAPGLRLKVATKHGKNLQDVA